MLQVGPNETKSILCEDAFHTTAPTSFHYAAHNSISGNAVHSFMKLSFQKAQFWLHCFCCRSRRLNLPERAPTQQFSAFSFLFPHCLKHVSGQTLANDRRSQLGPTNRKLSMTLSCSRPNRRPSASLGTCAAILITESPCEAQNFNPRLLCHGVDHCAEWGCWSAWARFWLSTF